VLLRHGSRRHLTNSGEHDDAQIGLSDLVGYSGCFFRVLIFRNRGWQSRQPLSNERITQTMVAKGRNNMKLGYLIAGAASAL
jgi:hypothetical protein